MDERHAGEGEIYRRGANEPIGRFPYSWRRYEQAGGRIHTDLAIDLDKSTATRLSMEKPRLLLQLADSMYQPFEVSGVDSVTGQVRVLASGELQEDTI
jgi:hypothetical protein